jgi:hypothetical protein
VRADGEALVQRFSEELKGELGGLKYPIHSWISKR